VVNEVDQEKDFIYNSLDVDANMIETISCINNSSIIFRNNKYVIYVFNKLMEYL
jgi:hypothetical protein